MEGCERDGSRSRRWSGRGLHLSWITWTSAVAIYIDLALFRFCFFIFFPAPDLSFSGGRRRGRAWVGVLLGFFTARVSETCQWGAQTDATAGWTFDGLLKLWQKQNIYTCMKTYAINLTTYPHTVSDCLQQYNDISFILFIFRNHFILSWVEEIQNTGGEMWKNLSQVGNQSTTGPHACTYSHIGT